MITFITPTEIAPAGTSSWDDVDLSSYCPAGTSGVLVRVTSGDAATNFGLRKNGSTDNRTNLLYNLSQTYALMGVDANRVIELYRVSTNITFTLLAYFDADVVFFDNGVDKTPGTPNWWTDIDISGDTGTDTALAAIFECVTTDVSYNWGLQMNGSDDERVKGMPHSWGVIGVDGSEICEGYTAANAYLFLIGYIKAGVSMNLYGEDVSLGSTGSWEDLSTSLTTEKAAIIETISSTYTGRALGLRADGDSDETYLNMQHGFAIVQTGAGGVIEGKIASTASDFYIVGAFFIPPVTISAGLDLCLTASLYQSLGLDMLLAEEPPVNLDLVLTAADLTQTTSLDMSLANLVTQTIDLDMALHKQGVTKTLSADMVILKENITKALSADFYAYAIWTKGVGLDMALYQNELYGANELEIEGSGESLSGAVSDIETEIAIESEGAGMFGSATSGAPELGIESEGDMLAGSATSGGGEIEIESAGEALAGTAATGQGELEVESAGESWVSSIVTASNELAIEGSGEGVMGYASTLQGEIGLEGSGEAINGTIATGSGELYIGSEGIIEVLKVLSHWVALAMNTETFAVSEYSNYGFNSFCKFGDSYLGAKSDGIYELTGDDDGVDGEGERIPIDLKITWHNIDPHLPALCKLAGGYLSGASEEGGEIKVTITCDDDVSQEEILGYLGERRDHPIDIAKGFDGREYEFKVENVDGAEITVKMLRVMAEPVSNRRR